MVMSANVSLFSTGFTHNLKRKTTYAAGVGFVSSLLLK